MPLCSERVGSKQARFHIIIIIVVVVVVVVTRGLP
jgi:t-SNARE complex subunit (syntaxin)